MATDVDHSSALPLTPSVSSSVSSQSSSGRKSPVAASPTLQRAGSSNLEESFVSLKLDASGGQDMFSRLQAIFQEVEETEGFDLVELQHVLQLASATHRRGLTDVDFLEHVRAALDQLWDGGSRYMTAATTVLADASREVRWRRPFGESGVLDFYLGVLAISATEHSLMLQALRLVGNSCADTDYNRQRVLERNSIISILKLVYDPQLTDTAIPVLYNICTDYEPAQQQAANDGTVSVLVRILQSGDYAWDPLLSYLWQLLEYTTSPPLDVHSSPENTAGVLIETATKSETDLETFLGLTNIAIHHLQEERFQTSLIREGSVESAVYLLVRSYAFEDTSAESTAESADPTIGTGDVDQLQALRNALILVLAEISALPEFAATFTLDSRLMLTLQAWLSVTQKQLQVCACVMLGNYARSDAACKTMVQQLQLHEPLILLLQNSEDTRVLHSAAGYLKNIALPLTNKEVLGKAGLLGVLPRLWRMEVVPQVPQAAASIARQLVSNSYANVQRLLEPLSPDTDSPAHRKTYLSLLLSLNERSDVLATKVEVARTITAICRILNSSQPGVSPEHVRETTHRLYDLHPEIGRPLAAMVSQSTWPVVRSEGWFAFALMARSREGSRALSDVVHSVSVFQPLVETITGKGMMEAGKAPSLGLDTAAELATGNEEQTAPGEDESGQQSQMKRRDRDNALILVSELLRNTGDEMSSVKRNVLEDLLHG